MFPTPAERRAGGGGAPEGAVRALAALLLCLGWLWGCASDVVIRAPEKRAAPREGLLGSIEPLAIELSPVAGPGSRDDPVGSRDGAWGQRAGEVELTENPAVVMRRLVSDELRRAGHRLVRRDADVVLSVSIRDFSVRSESDGMLGEVTSSIRFNVRVEETPGGEDFFEFTYAAERSGRTFGAPGIRSMEQVLAECLDDALQLVADDPGLASALERMAEVHRVRRSMAPHE